MTDVPQGRPAGRLDLLQVLFWSSLAVGVAAAGVAITAGPSVGRAGAILLILLAATGLVLFMWLSRGPGRKHGAFPERGAIEAHTLGGGGRAEFLVLDALDEPALITDSNLSPVAANGAYVTLADSAGALGESDRPPAMSRLFGADPMLSAPMFRLARAAQASQTRREELPATVMSAGTTAKRFEASVGPMAGGRVLWRLREVANDSADAENDNEDARRTFLDDAPIGFFSARADGAITYMNRALRAVLGVGDDPARLKVKDIVKEDAARLIRRDRRGFGPLRAPITLRARDGVESPASALTFWTGEREGAMRAFVFFAEQEAPIAPTQPAVPREREAADGVFDHAPFGTVVLDGVDPAAAAILDANAAFMEMTQGRAAPGATFAELFDASDGPVELASRLRRAVNQPTELQLATNPPIAAHVHFARGADGKGLAYIVNVTEQRELEQRLAQSEKMREIGLLAGGVAHDFNNLLMVVMQNCDYLLRRHPVGDPDFMDLQEINAHALRAKELSEMLRAYARQQTFRREVFDVNDFIGGGLQVLIRRLMGESAQFHLIHGRDVPMVKVDKSQLERVLVNLASNARDAMTPKGEGIARDGALTIRTGLESADQARLRGYNPIEDGDYAVIEVEDTGMGIKPEDAQKIFRPFHSTKGEGKGTGLGLATSYGIVKQSGGYIFFDSTPGKGTTFRIYLPAHVPTTEEAEDMARKEREAIIRPVTDVAGAGRILLVEDQNGVRKAIARNLIDCGFEIVQAEHGEEALDKLKEDPGGFDLIISDVSMPFMTGPEMLKEAGPEMIGKAKVLFLSGYAPESFESLLAEFPVSYMSKPVGMPQLAKKVKDLLAQAS